MAYQSALNDAFEADPNSKTINGFGLLPLRTKLRGPAPKTEGEDIVDEAITYFRANILMAAFDSTKPADKVLLYVTLFLTQCLRRLDKEAVKDFKSAQKVMFELAKEKFPVPGDKNWPLGGHITAPKSRDQLEEMRKYMEQLREEATSRIIEKVLDPATGEKNKFWMQFAKKYFLNIRVE